MYNPGLPTEWNISDQIRRETSGLAKSYELDATRSDVRRLEHSTGEARSACDELRAQLQETAQGVTSITEVVSQLLDRIADLEARLRLVEGDFQPANDLVAPSGPFGVGA